MNRPELKDSIGKTHEKNELNCFVAGIFYVCEILFYPPLMLIYYLLSLILGSVFGIIIGALMCVLIGFFPFYLLCCFCEKGRPIGSMLCLFSAIGILLVVISALYLAFSPIVAVVFFLWTYVLIFTGKVSPYNSFSENWATMTSYLAKNKDYIYKMYEERKGKFGNGKL